MRTGNWHDNISQDIKNLIDLDKVAGMFVDKINHYEKNGSPKYFTLRMATKDMVEYLRNYNIKKSDITHLLHCCAMEFCPRMYSGCGCHEHLQGNI